MKILRPVAAAVLLVSLAACKHSADRSILYERMGRLLEEGEFAELEKLADSLKTLRLSDNDLVAKADSFVQIAGRIAIDFSVPEADFIDDLKKRTGGYSLEEFRLWEKNNWLERREINGEIRYFRRAASNLVRLRDFNLRRAYFDSLNSVSPEIRFRLKHIESVIRAARENSAPVVPVEMTITYSLTVKSDAVPEGEIVRCWLPYPREDQPRQQKVKLISASHGNYIVSPDSVTHRTIFMEGRAVKGIPLVFKVEFSYQFGAQYYDPDNINNLPSSGYSGICDKYISEQLPHICFTERVKKLADSIAGNEKEPFRILKKLYYWIDSNIPWAGALEYSTIPCIPEYVLANRRGDCGMKTFLLMSMLRYKGIPVRWQSGWMMPPDDENLHDWCEVFIEGTGWLPVDMSYGLQYSDDKKIKEFYLSGIDSYRLIVNNGVSGKLFPPKKFLRSETLDFQRGEVEWEGGNLYFNEWTYNMGIEYTAKSNYSEKRNRMQLTP